MAKYIPDPSKLPPMTAAEAKLLADREAAKDAKERNKFTLEMNTLGWRKYGDVLLSPSQQYHVRMEMQTKRYEVAREAAEGFKKLDKVVFGKAKGKKKTGTIIGLNALTARVLADDGSEWNVSYPIMTKAE